LLRASVRAQIDTFLDCFISFILKGGGPAAGAFSIFLIFVARVFRLVALVACGSAEGLRLVAGPRRGAVRCAVAGAAPVARAVGGAGAGGSPQCAGAAARMIAKAL
jgi:hypothetical protein